MFFFDVDGTLHKILAMI
ncbi:Protein of unknown function [Bacillus wiedmannii]|uniref:Uncharacterized protein n=2 Tax=Bacillus cereus group TaxID=86661 RepID=A0A1C4FNW6_BACTU|nr:Protein of unknown function [Bacillus wiedmannii]SCC57343.1 Protein of unknown function [Bacillus thuringiensis]